jgi:hypothetical protein
MADIPAANAVAAGMLFADCDWTKGGRGRGLGFGGSSAWIKQDISEEIPTRAFRERSHTVHFVGS